MFTKSGGINFNPDIHTYTNSAGEVYLSVSRLIAKAREEFQENKIAHFVALKKKCTKEDVLNEWGEKRDRGTTIHSVIQNYHDTMTISDENKGYTNMLKELSAYFTDYARAYQEVILCSHKYKIAGTTDKLCLRTNRREKNIIDVYEYKTGKEEYVPKNRKYYLDPLSFLEDSGYMHDCLQLSCYAFMAEEMLGDKINIGRLAIIYIDKDLKTKLVPVCYMKLEAELLFKKFGFQESIIVNNNIDTTVSNNVSATFTINNNVPHI